MMKIGHVARNPEISLKEQLKELRGKYAEFAYVFCAGSVHGGSTITFTYEEEKEMPKKYVVFNQGGWKFTNAENYHSQIRNERRVTNCADFESGEAVRDWFCANYPDMKPEDFEIIG